MIKDSGVDARIVQSDTIYRSHDRVLEHKAALFSYLRESWGDLFHADYGVLLYDITSNYLRSAEGGRRWAGVVLGGRAAWPPPPQSP